MGGYGCRGSYGSLRRGPTSLVGVTMRRADTPDEPQRQSEPDPLPRLPRDVLALMAAVSTRLRDVAVVSASPGRAAAKARSKAPTPRAERRRITVAQGWAPRPAAP